MRICIHRGSKQIGGSCVEIESQGQRLVIDLGLPLDAEENISKYLPQVIGLDGKDPTLLGILISHPHIDHFGLLANISPTIPVGMGTAARRILKAAAPFLPGKWSVPNQGWNYQSRKGFVIGAFRVTPFLVDHSAYDAYALLIEGDGKKLFYSGDFRAHGRKETLFDSLVANPPKNISTLLLEGSSLGRLDNDQHFPKEKDIETQLVQVFSETEGLAMVHTSAQNIDRIVSIFRASKRTGRKLVIDLYTAAVLEATGNNNIPQSDWPEVALFVPHFQRIQIKQNAWFDMLKRHATHRIYIEDLKDVPKNSTLLFRPLHQLDLGWGDCLKNAAYIYSQWDGYWEKDSYAKLKEWLDKHDIQKINIHTSGHASPHDLKGFVEAINPGKVVPIHSLFPERYPDLFPGVEIHNDGEWWDA